MSTDLLASGYLLRRLAATRRAQELSASIQFDLARSPLSDDELEDALGEFGAERGRSGWGFSEIFSELLSREPKRIPAGDIDRLQRNLIGQGYMPPGTRATGEWTPVWYGAFRRWDADLAEEQMQGRHWLAAPVQAGMNLITNTLPSRVFQGIVGTARGLVEQAPETGERLGAAGGAAAGAALGSLIPGVGTVAGAIGGGVIGFLADLFGKDEGEEDQSAVMALLDPLIPNEWAEEGGARKFFEDLGWVASAASMIAGGKMAAQGLRAGLAGIRGVQAATASPFLQAALTRSPLKEPGWFTRISAAALKPALGSNRVERAVDFVKSYGLLAQANRPFFRTISGGYTGFSAGQLGARVAAGFGSGESETTLEAAIREAPELPAYADLASFLIYPSRFFPFEAGKVARAATRLLGDADLWPYVHAAQADGLSLAQARARALELLGADPAERALVNTRLRLDYGIHRRAAEVLADAGLAGTEARAQGAWEKARADLIGGLREEAEAGKSDLAQELLSYSLPDRSDGSKGSAAFAAWLLELGARGKGLERVGSFLQAERLAQRITRDLRAGVIAPEAVSVIGGTRFSVSGGFERLTKGQEIARTLDRATELERQARKATDPAVSVSLQAEAAKIRTEAEALKAALPAPVKEERGIEQLVITPERLDTPTQAELYALRREYLASRQAVTSSFEAGNEAAHLVARQTMSEFVDDLAFRGIMPPSMVEGAKTAKPSKTPANYLSQRARGAARDIELAPGIMRAFESLGYKPVVTGQEVLFTDEVPKLAELMGAGDYTRRAGFFETIGLSPQWRSDRSVFALRAGHEAAELEGVFAEAGIKLSGEEARRRLYEKLRARNHEGVVRGPLVFPAKGKPRLFKVDVRELTVDDILVAFEDVSGFTNEAAFGVLHALKRGAAFGGEARLSHPMDTARAIGKALRVNGLPGFSDVVRTWHVEDPGKLILAGAGAGAALGAIEGDDKIADALKGAAGGAVVGLGARAFAKGAYGYLPDRLFRATMALRYALSPSFDAGRYMEQNMIAAAKFNLPAILAPQRYVKTRTGLKSLNGGRSISGDEAWSEAVQLWDEINGGRGLFPHIDDLDRRASQAGLLGFKPWDWEAAQAYLLAQRGWSKKKIAGAIPEIGRYGVGRTAVEKSAHFVFFPFSFSKKFLLTLGDWFLQAPARALLLHEGMRRYYQAGLDEKFHDFIESKAPLLEQLARLNNLAYGLSPGRFFLEGFDDNRTNTGKVAQALASLFVPGGAATPLAQAAGAAGDRAVHAFVPVVVTGESIDRVGGADGLGAILTRYLPLVRDVERFARATDEQLTALAEGATPWSQFTDYQAELRGAKEEFAPLAAAMGYASVDGLLQSDGGAGFRAQLEEIGEKLAQRYPTGFRMAQEFTNTQMLNEKALTDLAAKPNLSEAEEAILALAEQRQVWRQIGEFLGLPQEAVLAVAAEEIREAALKRVKDRRFSELYERFFAREFGPLLVAA